MSTLFLCCTAVISINVLIVYSSDCIYILTALKGPVKSDCFASDSVVLSDYAFYASQFTIS